MSTGTTVVTETIRVTPAAGVRLLIKIHLIHKHLGRSSRNPGCLGGCTALAELLGTGTEEVPNLWAVSSNNSTVILGRQ